MCSTCVVIHLDSLRKDNWDVAQVEVLMLQAQGKVIYYQPYVPKEKDPRKRPFVVVFQDDFMRRVTQRFSHGNSWALDSTFKT
jgi:glutathione synthase/RimK-type ligase-like ATP-grasp enzyme